MRLSAAPVMPTLPVTDLARARKFYVDVLGLKPVRESGGDLALAAGDTVLYLYLRPPSPAEHTLASFAVEDVRATIAELRAAGVVFEDYDLPDLRTVDGVADLGEDGLAAWFKDPDGNILAVGDAALVHLPGRGGRLGTPEEEANRAAIRKLWREAVNPKTMDRALARYARNTKYHGFGGEEVRGRAAVGEMMAAYHAAFGDMQVRFADVIASGDRTVTRVKVTATHQGEFAGQPPSGRRLEFEGITISKWRKGEIVEEWEAFDMAALGG